jgi:3-hydroxyacyl-[acyl-carrier-protein] dehydratase
LNITDIMAAIQHRYPFLLVDRILELDPGKRIVGLKNVTMNEEFFQGHFPGNPIMPGVLIVEHAAQVSCLLMFATTGNQGMLGLFAGIDEMKFRRRVIPGDQLITEVNILRVSGRAGKVRIVSRVDGEVAAEGQLTFMLVPDPMQQQPPGKEE